jgi:hypothetical protein
VASEAIFQRWNSREAAYHFKNEELVEKLKESAEITVISL